MIDFRYHLVSIVAIFLALTIGIVLGNAVLKEPLIESLETTSNTLQKQNTELRGQIRLQERNAKGNDAFVQGTTKQLVNGLLGGQKIVIVEAPGAGTVLRDPIEKVLTEGAGGVVTGRITLHDKFLEEGQASLIDAMANQFQPAGVQFPPTATVYDKAAAVLASAVVTPDPAQAGREYPAGDSVLDAFQQAGWLTVSGKPGQRATLAVVIAGQKPYEGPYASMQTQGILSIAKGLDAGSRGAAVAGTPDQIADGGVITALRSGDAKSKVSSEDSAELPSGRVVIVYALVGELKNQSAQYGIGTSEFLPVPPPAPVPLPAGTPTS